MLNSKYQRVGALAGLLMIIGAWLTGYYNNWVVAAITVVVVGAAFWYALEDDTNEDLGTRTIRGFLVGLIAALVARILGMLTMAWTYDSWSSPVTSQYDSIADTFRVLFNGNLTTSLIGILSIAALGAFIAYALPYFTAEREEE